MRGLMYMQWGLWVLSRTLPVFCLLKPVQWRVLWIFTLHQSYPSTEDWSASRRDHPDVLLSSRPSHWLQVTCRATWSQFQTSKIWKHQQSNVSSQGWKPGLRMEFTYVSFVPYTTDWRKFLWFCICFISIVSLYVTESLHTGLQDGSTTSTPHCIVSDPTLYCSTAQRTFTSSSMWEMACRTCLSVCNVVNIHSKNGSHSSLWLSGSLLCMHRISYVHFCWWVGRFCRLAIVIMPQ